MKGTKWKLAFRPSAIFRVSRLDGMKQTCNRTFAPLRARFKNRAYKDENQFF